MGLVVENIDSLDGSNEAIPRYDLDRDGASLLCQEFLNTPEAIDAPSFGCYKFEANHPYANLGRFVESTVFSETFGNTSGLMQEEYGPYEESSDFYVVIDHAAKLPIGVMRVIKPTDSGLKSLVDLSHIDQLNFSQEDVYEGYGIDRNKCADIATLAILPEYRSSVTGDFTPSLLMYRALYLNILSSPDFTHVVNIIDKKAERNLTTLKFPFKPVFDSDYFPYLDSPASHLLIAENSAFHPVLTDEVSKLNQELNSKQSGIKAFLASTINSLINPTELDVMLAPSVASKKN